LDSDGQLVDAHYLNMGEVISPGSEISLPCHRVMVGAQDQPVVRPPLEPTPATSLDLRPGIGLQN
jgi:hypothetical protein